jgi:ADP-ribose pyrophosphatase
VSVPDADQPVETAWEGKWITVKRQGRWEYVSRARGIRAAVILAVEDGHVLLVEQYRVPLGRRCLELPAGLIGDDRDDDTVLDAANRELMEETGYRADRADDLGEFHSSPGMVSESFSLVRVHGLTQVAEGGGIGDEDITVHRVPLAEVPAFVAAKRGEGVAVDVKVLLLLTQSMLV